MPTTILLNENIIGMEYAIRGPIPQRAEELKKQGRITIPCNIGNPQALGQEPISFYRQVLGLIEDPSRINREKQLLQLARKKPDIFEGIEVEDFVSDYVLTLSENLLKNLKTGTGAYTESQGPLFIREAIARYIDQRDDAISNKGLRANPEHIYLTNGASEAAKSLMEILIGREYDGIMIPIPQYPLYSAVIKKCGGVQVNYYPDEDSGWTLNRETLEKAYSRAERNGVRVKGIVVINPCNPTGAILDEASIHEVIDFAEQHGIVIIADEVYQENLYGDKFISFARVLGNRDVPLFSLHSISKGFYGECGHRGGYVEVRHPPLIEERDISFTDILFKQASVCLCSNTAGQVLTYLMVNPPEEGSPPYEKFTREKYKILKDLFEKAVMIKEAFKQMEGVECFGRIGAMYLFPRLNKLPKKTTDFEYCMNLLEQTGLCTVNGSGFGQKEGTNHLRIAFLPPGDLLEQVLPEWIKFHNEYVNKKKSRKKK
ncbi:aminotransferase class I/II-fold pyridoxal phosphate-dependent enzyme [Candidatus Riflebacteria bacterium]